MTTEHDVFARTAAALSDTLRAHPSLLSGAPAQFRNYLLDACGSDHRPLVDLLLSVAVDLRPRLAAVAAAPSTDVSGSNTATRPAAPSWETRRAPLVHQLVATRYLQPDVARWLVDSWGAALGVAPAVVQRPTLMGAGPAGSVVPGAGDSIGTGAFTRAVGVVPAPATARGAATPPAPLRPPTWPAGAAAPRAGSTTPLVAGSGKTSLANATSGPGMARATTPRWRTHAPAMNAASIAQMQRLERVSLGVILAAGIAVYIAAAIAIAGRHDENVLAAAVLPVVAAGSAADSVLADATGSMRPLPATSEPAASDTTTTAAALQPPVPLGGAAVISRGIGGRYRVAQRALGVSGSPSCSKVADALATGRTSIEVITHEPGTFTFALASRSVIGTLDGSAYFEAGPMHGTTDGVTWNFRMRGRFTEHGFTAETQTATEAILRWGKRQECMTVAELVAERIPE